MDDPIWVRDVIDPDYELAIKTVEPGVVRVTAQLGDREAPETMVAVDVRLEDLLAALHTLAV